MVYASQANLVTLVGEQELINLTDRVNVPPSAIDAAVVDRALRAADSEIDSYIGTRYGLPLASVPDIIQDQACVIALYKLNTVSMPEDVADRYKDAIRWLRDVQAGKASVPGLSESSQAPSGGVVIVESSPRLFARGGRGVL